jgi:hypothetical protein
MEMTQLFTFLVLGICATHIVWSASAQIANWWGARRDSRSRNTALAGPVRQRDDWYVFFNCSDLVGPDPIKKNTISANQNRAQKQQKNPRPQIRPSAN